MSTTTSNDLAQQWADLKREAPHLRARDAAERLGCSEAALLSAASITPEAQDGLEVNPLGGEPSDLLAQVSRLGRVMALTRNDAVVSETYGAYGDIEHGGSRGLVHNDGIDLRIDFSHWHHVFAVRSRSSARELSSLQFFDRDGTAVHKVYLTAESGRAAYDRIVNDQAADDRYSPQFRAAEPSTDRRGSTDVDVEALRERWSKLTNVHQFAGMLHSLGVSRHAAVRHVGPEFASPAPKTAYRTVLSAVREAGIPIMVFVRSPGCTQIYTGSVNKLMESGEYYNVFDEEFHLHIREPRIADAWVVRKPTTEDTVTSLEVYGLDDELSVQLFGVRDAERKESRVWRDCLEGL